ncbi:sigma-70 family RNA polymerase sigma factor [Roseivirga sp. UBA838]|uniref:sigma-70 family RNA polymerase sigma factor n=1 Tax=Roseivirga sp. UBA838 TaxID=1947393 RepID=UPI00257DE060|nr:sigma-70 family RNA polymerase sigma factor [Roseivirga sp. UBA838]|tara:strand:- start:13759 stop:14766 length:1008 start_codon:yes stop_codon:yes gene_type:complete
MKVTIHNKHLLKGDGQISQFEEAIKHHQNWFEKLNALVNLNRLDAYLTEQPGGLKATFYLKQSHNQIFVEAEGKDPAVLAEQLMTRLKSRYLRQLISSRKRIRLDVARDNLSQLENLKKQEDREHFGFLVKQLLPAIRGFVARYLSHTNSKVTKEFTIDDLVDEIYIALYDRFDERPQKTSEFSPWSFQIAREKLDDFLENYGTKDGEVSLEKLAAEELKNLEEKFTADAEGELIMQEDLDDTFYTNGQMGNEILTNDALLDLPEEVEIEPVVNEVLAEAGETNKLAFELFWLHEMTANEIAKALRLQIETVVNIIDNVTNSIVSRLKSVSHEDK